MNTEFKKLEWLTGKWEGIQGIGLYHEEWEKISDGFKGRAYFIKKGEILNSESLVIYSRDSEIYYEADVSHNPQPVSFKMTFLDNDKVIFENPNHDFPQKITYEKKQDGFLLATIEALQNGKGKKVEFNLKKIL